MKKRLFCLMFALTFLVAAMIPTRGFAASDTLHPVAAFVSGEEYVMAISGIHDYRGSFGEACVTGEEESEYGLGYALRPKTLTAAKDCLWKITQKENGSFTLYSTSAKQYLHMEADKASLSDEDIKETVEIASEAFEVVRERHPL